MLPAILAAFLLTCSACRGEQPAVRSKPKDPSRATTRPSNRLKKSTWGISAKGPIKPQWRRRTLASARVSLELLDAEVHEVKWKTGGGTIYQALNFPGRGAIRLAIRAGKGEDLSGFRRDHPGWHLSPEEPTTVCGHAARLLHATHAAQHITCVITAQGNHPAYIAPQAALAVAFTHRGVPITVKWSVESEKLGDFEAARKRFLASIRCD